MEVLIFQKEAFEEMAAFHGTCGCHPYQAGRQVIKPMAGQPRCLPAVEHQSAHLAYAAGQRYAGLFADKPQGVLQTGGCDAYRQACGEQT